MKEICGKKFLEFKGFFFLQQMIMDQVVEVENLVDGEVGRVVQVVEVGKAGRAVHQVMEIPIAGRSVHQVLEIPIAGRAVAYQIILEHQYLLIHDHQFCHTIFFNPIQFIEKFYQIKSQYQVGNFGISLIFDKLFYQLSVRILRNVLFFISFLTVNSFL